MLLVLLLAPLAWSASAAVDVTAPSPLASLTRVSITSSSTSPLALTTRPPSVSSPASSAQLRSSPVGRPAPPAPPAAALAVGEDDTYYVDGPAAEDVSLSSGNVDPTSLRRANKNERFLNEIKEGLQRGNDDYGDGRRRGVEGGGNVTRGEQGKRRRRRKKVKRRKVGKGRHVWRERIEEEALRQGPLRQGPPASGEMESFVFEPIQPRPHPRSPHEPPESVPTTRMSAPAPASQAGAPASQAGAPGLPSGMLNASSAAPPPPPQSSPAPVERLLPEARLPPLERSYPLQPEETFPTVRPLTTPSQQEMESKKKEKKLARFVKFVNKNRELLRSFIDKKRGRGRAGAGEGRALRGGRGDAVQFRGEARLRAEDLPLRPEQMDLAPARGARIANMRLKGRLCQRNVMFPEGPKYNSEGHIYVPSFKEENGRGYASTRRRGFVLPACCNCCEKSVLGCE